MNWGALTASISVTLLLASPWILRLWDKWQGK